MKKHDYLLLGMAIGFAISMLILFFK